MSYQFIDSTSDEVILAAMDEPNPETGDGVNAVADDVCTCIDSHDFTLPADAYSKAVAAYLELALAKDRALAVKNNPEAVAEYRRRERDFCKYLLETGERFSMLTDLLYDVFDVNGYGNDSDKHDAQESFDRAVADMRRHKAKLDDAVLEAADPRTMASQGMADDCMAQRAECLKRLHELDCAREELAARVNEAEKDMRDARAELAHIEEERVKAHCEIAEMEHCVRRLKMFNPKVRAVDGDGHDIF